MRTIRSSTPLVNKTLWWGVTGNMTVAGDIGVIGDANVDGSMNVVGNVLLTSGSSAGSRFISGRRYQPTSRGVGGGWGGCIWT
jgi:hypothetical protein